MSSPTIIVPKKWTPKMLTHVASEGGRRYGKPHGSHVDDLAALRRAIVLCGQCHFRFDWKRHGYYSVKKYESTLVRGKCFACTLFCEDGRLFIHEDHRPKAWTTVDERKKLGRRVRP